MAEMSLYKVMDLDADGVILDEKKALKNVDAERMAFWDLMDDRVCAVAIYRYKRALGCYTHMQTVFRKARLMSWEEGKHEEE